MQNRNIYFTILLFTSLVGGNVFAQNAQADQNADPMGALSDFSSEVSQKKTVDFPARSSLDSMELAPLPGIYETNMTGPQPMAESVSVNDMPSEQLLGRLTPEVFQEMAELERDTAYLKLQALKEDAKNDLEKKRAQYRQDRLDEISNREKIVRERILWWQEQEKLRQEMEKERAEAEEIKNQIDETEALKAQLEAAAEAAQNSQKKEENEEGENKDSEEPIISVADIYVLQGVKGTRGNLVARLKNIQTEEMSTVKVGDSLGNSVVVDITSDSVVVERDGIESKVTFPAT